MSEHPQRCETCSHYGGHICYQQHNRMSNIEHTLIEMVGCASHSSTRPRPAPTDEQCQICSRATERKAREDVLKTLDLWRIKRMNGMLKKDVWKGWNDETDFIKSLRQDSTQAGEP